MSRERSPLVRALVFALLLFGLSGLLEFGHWFRSARGILRHGSLSAGGPGARVESLLQSVGVASSPPGFVSRALTAPSSRVVEPDMLRKGQSLVSVVLAPEDLHDPVHGILANPGQRGRDWERPGWLSVYSGKRLEFATRVGVRVHGGSSRTTRREGFRVYFRPSFGLPAAPEDLIDTPVLPAERLVVRQSQMRPQFQPIAFDLARQMGSAAPAATSVRFALNGELRRTAYELSEHIARDGWGRSYFGHDEFRLFEYRSSNRPADRDAFDQLVDWVESRESPFLASQLNERIDVELLMRHLFTILYCGTRDWAQGAAVLNLRDPDARWFWVHWDLDQSFHAKRNEPAVGPSIGLILSPARPSERRDLRAVMFRRLVDEDPDFPRRFAYLGASLLAHRLHPGFLRDLADRYSRLAVRRKRPFGGYDLRTFFEKRGPIVLAALGELAGLPPPVRVSVDAPKARRLVIDGFEHGNGYSALHFPGQEIAIEAFDDSGQRYTRWRVDDHRRRSDALRIIVDEETQIEARGQ